MAERTTHCFDQGVSKLQMNDRVTLTILTTCSLVPFSTLAAVVGDAGAAIFTARDTAELLACTSGQS